MNSAGMLLAVLRFVLWEAALLAAAVRVVALLGYGKRDAVSKWLAIVALQVVLEATAGGLLSFARANTVVWYLAIAGVCALGVRWVRLSKAPAAVPWVAGVVAALATPLLMLSFRPVEEIDSINYLHYLIDWMGNRATPFTFATNYVAFWELSFLPTWMVTGVDLFFPLLALKAVLILGLAGWLIGRELGLGGPVLAVVVGSGVAMRHFWYEYSGVPTLKNDALHGAGFALLVLVVLRASRRKLVAADVALLALGVAFSTVKYTGLFLAPLAVAAVIALRAVCWRGLTAVSLTFLLTSGPYYLRSLLEHGSPFYPFQINLGPIHLPGTADLSYSSILYNLHDPRLWRAFLLPEGGVSPAGFLFPEVLVGTLLVAVWICLRWLKRRGAPSPLEWTSCFLLAGWLLYFRSVFSATGEPGGLTFVLNSLNSLRYVDGVLLVSELFLASLLGKYCLPLAALNGASRLVLLYAKVPFPALAVAGIAVGAGLLFWLLARTGIRVLAIGSAAALALAGPVLVEANRVRWTTYWDDLKPALAQVRGSGLWLLSLEDGGYFAGHVVAAGNPVNPRVRTVSLEALEALPEASRPRTLAVLVTSGSAVATTWQERYGARLGAAGYRASVTKAFGGVYQRERE